MTSRRRAPWGDRGETLLEIAISVLILSIGAVAVLSAVSTAVALAASHRERSVAGRLLDNFAEYMKGVAYVPCAGTAASSYATGATQFRTAASTVGNAYYEPTTSRFVLTLRVDAGTPAPGSDPSTVFPALTSAQVCAAAAAPYDTAATDDRVERLTLTVTRVGDPAGTSVQLTKARA